MEPIRKILPSETALARIARLQATQRVERRDPEADPDTRKRRAKPRPPSAGGAVHRDADGVPHVDVQA